LGGQATALRRSSRQLLYNSVKDGYLFAVYIIFTWHLVSYCFEHCANISHSIMEQKSKSTKCSIPQTNVKTLFVNTYSE